METHEAFTKWAVEKGVKINGLAAHKFEGRGLGIIAEKRHEANTILLTTPVSALRTAHTVPKSLTRALPAKTTVHNLLAVDLALDASVARAPWRAVLPTYASFVASLPLLWAPSLQPLLPPAAAKLLFNQQSKLKQDWAHTSSAFPDVKYEKYLHAWCLINTRTFYFVSPTAKGRNATPKNRDDCMALNPFADYFNHNSSASACEVEFSSAGYSITTPSAIEEGDEVYISYGNHNNDFLLAEYGFILAGDTNEWDEVDLSTYVLEILSAEQKEFLKDEGFLGDYVLDREKVCHRTQVALRCACLPVGKWRRFVSGADDGEREQGQVDLLLLRILGKCKADIGGKLEQVDALGEEMEEQRDTLGRRWRQIAVLLQRAVDRIQN